MSDRKRSMKPSLCIISAVKAKVAERIPERLLVGA